MKCVIAYCMCNNDTIYSIKLKRKGKSKIKIHSHQTTESTSIFNSSNPRKKFKRIDHNVVMPFAEILRNRWEVFYDREGNNTKNDS